MFDTITLNADLRARLNAGYESERENWDDEYTDACIAKLAGISDGEYSVNDDIDDDTDDTDTPTDLVLDPGNFIAVGIDYFGISA